MKRKIVKKQNPNIYAEVNLKTIQKLNSSIYLTMEESNNNWLPGWESYEDSNSLANGKKP